MERASALGFASIAAVRLWTESMEAMRGEAREVVAWAVPVVRELLRGGDVLPVDRDERVAFERKMMAQIYAPVSEAIDMTIAGVPCRVLLPDEPASAVYLHFHGGGMIAGAPEMSDTRNLDLCRRHALAVVSVGYRLAPEHPYPAGPNDGVAVAAWLLEHAAKEFGTNRLVLGGESAGGYLAAAVLIRVRDELRSVDRILGANLVYGVYDWGRSPSQRGLRPTDSPDILDPEGIRMSAEWYLPNRTDDQRRDPTISPAFADLRGLPPALMSVGSADHLLDDTLILAARWAAAGSEAELFVAPELPHGFPAFPCELTNEWVARTDRWFTETLATPT
jgi:acetyl esterase/lipase